jgi:ABC-type lipoprotein release transport system permease subunit
MKMFYMLAGIAWRNVVAHRVKSAIVGTLLFFGTFLVVTGKSLVDSIEHAMAESITSSLAGDLQIYDKNAKDPLQLFSFGGGGEDIGEIPDFPKLRDALAAVPEVRAVVPMGSVNTVVFGSTELDQALTKLRVATRASSVDAPNPERQDLLEQVQAIAAQLAEDQKVVLPIAADKVKAQEDLDALVHVNTDAFHQEFMSNPEGTLDWLDRTIAPLASDGKLMYLRVLGTEMGSFTQDFSRFHIVDGENIPEGKRGFLISKYAYERFVKNKVARELDDMKQKRDEDGLRFESDQALSDQAGRCSRQYARILFMLSPTDARAMLPLLQRELGSEEKDLGALIKAFLLVNDDNFEARYAFFYKEIASRIRLYDVAVGDTLTLRAYTRTGYMRSVNVKIWGTFEFTGLESSQLAGVYNLSDLVTFRQLYGKMSDSQLAELDDIRKSASIKEVTRANAEDELFGAAAEPLVGESAEAKTFDEFAGVDMTAASRSAAELDERVYSKADMENGVVLNAAVVLKDGASVSDAKEHIAAAAEAAGVPVTVLDWQTASGIVGQLLLVIKGVLVIAILVIFLVALFIINNSMMMATMERTAEIGTMRAIGAQRGQVLALFLIETLLLAVVASGLGAGFSMGLLAWLGEVGIKAPSSQAMFLFGGPRLFPAWSWLNVAFGMGSVSLISLASTFYPALMAARVQPVVAMNPKE